MTEYGRDYRYSTEGAPEADVEFFAFGFGCGASHTDGVCSGVVLRMATEIGPTAVVTRAEMTSQNARDLAARLIDLADKVDTGEKVPDVAD